MYNVIITALHKNFELKKERMKTMNKKTSYPSKSGIEMKKFSFGSLDKEIEDKNILMKVVYNSYNTIMK